MKSRPGNTEAELIESFTRAIDAAGVRPRGLVVGAGDDAAVLRGPSGDDYVVTQDIQVEGRHFERSWLGGRALGRRLAAVNLSDVAAMGARPLYGLFSLVLPSGEAGESGGPAAGPRYARQIAGGIVDELAAHGAALVGGNVSGTDGPLTCDLTLVGACPRGKAWLRHARVGDAIVVVGRLGEAAAGLELLRESGGRIRRSGRLVRAFVRPEPLLDVAGVLRGESGVRGAIDVSDGLSTDLIHVCEASSVGCEIDADAIAATRVLAEFCRRRDIDPLDWVMRGGEDYALILCVSPRRAEAVCRSVKETTDRSARVIGTFTNRRGHYAIIRNGKRRRFRASGWDHLRPVR